ncbi:hypothetical protein HZC27_05935 [Candidatus Roizmanbacteria bacterium]|nr:hypothetical protein [Candidatus Roizmanbacteria bacterium]
MKRWLFIICVLLQLLTIGYILYRFKKKTQNTLGTSIKVIDSKSIKRTPHGDLKYYYEPIADTISHESDNILPGKYTINKDTFNERFNYTPQKPDKVYRVMSIGDSYTFGMFVDTDRNWSEQLEDKLRTSCIKYGSYDVINLGVYAYDFAYEVERFINRGNKYSPDHIVWLVVHFERMTDAIEGEMRSIKENLKRTKTEAEITKITNKPYNIWLQASEQLKKKISHEENINYQNKQLKRFFSEYRGKVLFVLTPWISEEGEQMLKSYNTHDNVNIIRLSNNIMNLHFPTDTHPNVEGHKFIANEVFDYLDKENLCR